MKLATIILNTIGLVFTTIGNAMRLTGLSYLGSVNKSPKLAKNGKVSQQHTYGLYLAPAEVSGYNTCSHSTPECRMGCLNTSGRAGIEIFSGSTMINDCRIKKTKLFFEETAFFMAWLIADLKVSQQKAIEMGYGFSARLNCTSDIDWQKVLVDGRNIFQMFPDVNFYDYTKNPNKFKELPANYHLTFSYTGRNWKSCEAVLKAGHNVAVVFDVKSESELPLTFNGYKVVNGDLTDYRIDDAKGIIVGLKWKRIGNRDAERKVRKSCFVVRPAEVLETVNLEELVMA
jgi:hypothetical protein